jgi:hypothetical protein
MPQQSSVSSVVKHLTASQLADRLTVSEDHLRRAILGQPGGIPGLKLSDGPRAQWRIRLCDVEAWEQTKLVCYDAAPTRPRRR